VLSRREKAALSTGINSASITPERKRAAMNSFAEVVAELRTIEHDLGRLTGK
jgi:hypothetical protein